MAMFGRIVTAPQSDPDRTSRREPQTARDEVLRSALERLETVLQSSTAWRALQQLNERERNGEWLDVIEADLLHASLLEDLAREPAYLAWRDVSTALAETEHTRSLSEPLRAEPATASTPLPVVADRLPTVAPLHSTSSSNNWRHGKQALGHPPATDHAAPARHEPDRPVAAVAIGTGRLGSSDEAHVVIRRNPQLRTSIRTPSANPHEATSDVAAPLKQLKTPVQDEYEADVAIIRHALADRPSDPIFHHRGEAPASDKPHTTNPSEVTAETEATVTILRHGASPRSPCETQAPTEPAGLRQHRDDWNVSRLSTLAPRPRLLALTRKLQRSWRRD